MNYNAVYCLKDSHSRYRSVYIPFPFNSVTLFVEESKLCGVVSSIAVVGGYRIELSTSVPPVVSVVVKVTVGFDPAAVICRTH